MESIGLPLVSEFMKRLEVEIKTSKGGTRREVLESHRRQMNMHNGA